MNQLVDKYLHDGCMRCKFGGTPNCKVHNWTEALVQLRKLASETELKEEIKWGVPVYTLQGKNVVTINALKASANIAFFKGALLTDPQKILQRQGNIQATRIIRLTKTDEIEVLRNAIRSFIKEAIQVEKDGKKVTLQKNPEPAPKELEDAFKVDPAFKKAFYALTPGRQRGYIIFISQAKQSQTRIKRIEQNKVRIGKGLGLNDR